MRIVLIHGFPGFSRVGNLEYFNGVADHLKNRFSDLEIIAPQLAPPFGLDTVRDRAGQLKNEIGARFGTEKVHLIAHSGGGIDARFLASPQGLAFGGQIASVTTISSPHHGSVIADLVAWPFGGLTGFLAGWTGVLGLLGGLRDFVDAVSSFTTDRMKEFNRRVEPAPGVHYLSFAGSTTFGPFHLFSGSAQLISAQDGANDGWISVNSATLPGQAPLPAGRIIPANHLEEVGLDPAGSFRHLLFFEQIVSGLPP